MLYINLHIQHPESLLTETWQSTMMYNNNHTVLLKEYICLVLTNRQKTKMLSWGLRLSENQPWPKSNNVCHPNSDNVHMGNIHVSSTSSTVSPQKCIEVIDPQLLHKPGIFHGPYFAMRQKICETLLCLRQQPWRGSPESPKHEEQSPKTSTNKTIQRKHTKNQI